MYFINEIMKIDQIEAEILTFEVPGSKTRFLPGTSLFLPAGDVGGEIKLKEYFASHS